MGVTEKIRDVQGRLKTALIDGWLLYDFHHNNSLAHEFLEMPADHILTRRFLYWIPAQGEPVKIVHAIESDSLDHLPGEKHVYLKWQTLEGLIATILKNKKVVAMEYSPRCAVPYVSKVDGGMIDLVREQGVKVVSSGAFFQYYTCVWDEMQLNSHLQAAKVLEEAVNGAWSFIAEHLGRGQPITEFEVQQFIMDVFEKEKCVTDHPPICAVNEHSAMPHYAPTEKRSKPIQKGDLILIDLWCKQNKPRAVFADITRVGIAASAPTAKQSEIFNLVRKAQQAAIEFVKARYAKGGPVHGFEVDEAARKVIADAGYGDFFTHRTGHNIHTDVHGPGTHMDSLETHDDRPLVAGTCFSVEPGIYLPGEFGVRLETDVYLASEGKVEVTGGVQENFRFLIK